MADDKDDSQKTEQPTSKRLQEARKKGDVVKSAEVSGVLVLAAATAIIATLGGPSANSVAHMLAGYISDATTLDPSSLRSRSFWGALAGGVALSVAAPILILLLVAVLSHIVQTGFIISGERLKPNLSKLNPVSGLKKLFGPGAAANLGKGMAKMAIVGSAAVASLWPRRDDVIRVVGVDASAILPIVRDAAVAMLIAALTVYALLAAIDYVGQRMAFMKRQRMTRQEVRDEHKQTEGDPQVRARLRRIRQERAQRRMIAAVPDATVVVTNPTHFAIALRYVQGETPAPICVAKGVDAVALKIREVAEEHGVPIMEDPPLARALFGAVDVDQAIPPDHYQAVAKIIGYVFTLAQRRGRRPR